MSSFEVPRKLLFTVQEVSEIIECHPETIRRWITDDKLATVKLAGTRWRIRRDDLITMLQTYREEEGD